MNEVAAVELEDLWSYASPKALQRTADLARRVLKAAGASIFSSVEGTRTVRVASGFDSSDAADHPPPAASIDVPVQLSSGREIGRLGVADQVHRDWTGEERGLLLGLAAILASQIELKLEARPREPVAKGPGTIKARLLAVADRIPALVFERRKIDAARSTYTFFGSTKTELPAVRQMMEDGGAGPLSFIHRDDRETMRAALLRSNVEETDLDLTFRVKDFDGRSRWLRSQSIVRRDPDGGVYWDGLCFDVTDLVIAREEAEAARAAADARLAELTAPLQAIVAFADLLKSEAAADLVALHARNIRTSAESLLAVLNRSAAPGAEPPAPPVALEPQPAQEPGGVRILLADDLDLNRKLVADMLGAAGHAVDCVADGQQAVHAAGLRPYDIILMDMIMPVMDGLSATRAIRALPGTVSRTPIVALTANSFDDQIDTCLQAGMDAVLTKPMSMDALLKAVDAWTRDRKAA